MATSKQAIATAAGELGHQGGAKYWAAMGYGSGYYSQPWCCIFVDWVMQQVGASIGSYANCLTIQTGLKAAGAVQVSPRQAQEGDVLIFEFDRAGDTYDHVGFCEINKGTYLQTVEGNVSNTVGRRTRAYEDVRQCWRPAWTKPVSGWYWLNGKCYHLTDGQLDKRAWFEGTGAYSGKWFYVGDKGYALTDAWAQGTGKYAGKWYWLGSKGYPVTNEWHETNGQTYYLGDDGAAVTGWLIIEGKAYHFDDEGVMERHTFAEYKNDLYYLGDDGAVLINGEVTLKTDDKGRVYLP